MTYYKKYLDSIIYFESGLFYNKYNYTEVESGFEFDTLTNLIGMDAILYFKTLPIGSNHKLRLRHERHDLNLIGHTLRVNNATIYVCHAFCREIRNHSQLRMYNANILVNFNNKKHEYATFCNILLFLPIVICNVIFEYTEFNYEKFDCYIGGIQNHIRYDINCSVKETYHAKDVFRTNSNFYVTFDKCKSRDFAFGTQTFPDENHFMVPENLEQLCENEQCAYFYTGTYDIYGNFNYYLTCNTNIDVLKDILIKYKFNPSYVDNILTYINKNTPRDTHLFIKLSGYSHTIIHIAECDQILLKIIIETIKKINIFKSNNELNERIKAATVVIQRR